MKKDLAGLKSDLDKLEAKYKVKLYDEDSSHEIPYYRLVQTKFIDYDKLEGNKVESFDSVTPISYKKASKLISLFDMIPYSTINKVLNMEVADLCKKYQVDYVIPSVIEKGSLKLTSSGNIKIDSSFSYRGSYLDYIRGSNLMNSLISISENKGLVFTGSLIDNSEYDTFKQLVSDSVMMSSMIDGNPVVDTEDIFHVENYDNLINYYSRKSVKRMIINKIKSVLEGETA